MLRILHDTKIDFIKSWRLAVVLTAGFIAAGLIALVIHGGLNRSIEFTGGTLMQLEFAQPPNIADIRATVDATEAAIPFLANSRHAAITYIGSKAGSLATPRMVAYGAAKAAMAHYMKSLSSRLLPAVRVNTVSPGDTLVEGGVWDKVRLNDPTAFDAVVKRNPMGRLAHADEIARVVAFVSSPAASFVSGANWYVDGGSIAHVQT